MRNDKELLSTIYDQTLHRVEQKWLMWYREPLAICCFLYSMNNFRKGTDCNFSHLQISSDCKGLVWWTPIHYYCAYSFVFFPFKKKKKILKIKPWQVCSKEEGKVWILVPARWNKIQQLAQRRKVSRFDVKRNPRDELSTGGDHQEHRKSVLFSKAHSSGVA